MISLERRVILPKPAGRVVVGGGEGNLRNPGGDSSPVRSEVVEALLRPEAYEGEVEREMENIAGREWMSTARWSR